MKLPAAMLCALVLMAGCGDGDIKTSSEPNDPAEVVLGERLFLETRFAQYFHARNGSNVNQVLAAGDPVLAQTQTTGAALPGPFAGLSMNCRACHLVDEQGDARAGGVRTYADFSRHSPVPEREDGRTLTPRNSPALVNSTLSRSGAFLLHFDGEFASTEELVEGTLTGRNFGWLPDEQATARQHIALVIRGDDGQGALAGDFGALSYRTVLLGTAAEIPPELVIPEELRIDVDRSSDAEVIAAVDRLIAEYVRSLVFAQDSLGEFSGSPYDQFLRKNDLPRSPQLGESDLDYGRRLRTLLDEHEDFRYVDFEDGGFGLHSQEFRFGRLELDGLRIFLSEPTAVTAIASGNCIACHAPPNFTDFSFHNTGVTQDEYDGIHGSGSFQELEIPSLTERNAAAELYLPPSALFPDALGQFLDLPAATKPGHTDLGLWNVFGNPAVPNPQAQIEALLCQRAQPIGESCYSSDLLELAIATFKTPGLRDLGQSGPYFHSGQFDSLQQAVGFYVASSAQARATAVRNADPELKRIQLDLDDVAVVVAFLQALNEDYE